MIKILHYNSPQSKSAYIYDLDNWASVILLDCVGNEFSELYDILKRVNSVTILMSNSFALNCTSVQHIDGYCRAMHKTTKIYAPFNMATTINRQMGVCKHRIFYKKYNNPFEIYVGNTIHSFQFIDSKYANDRCLISMKKRLIGQDTKSKTMVYTGAVEIIETI